jgi:transcriptional regulator with XRE-family HTH domain
MEDNRTLIKGGHKVCGPHPQSPLRMARVLEGLSQSDLGKIVGHSQSWASRLEAGLITASITQQLKISQALGIPADVLFREE